MMAAQKAPASSSAGAHLYRKFKRAIALEKPVIPSGGCGVEAKASANCKC
jgi:hypothetical protein